MLIYNNTIRINWDIQPSWLLWMKEQYIPQVMGTNCFTRFQLVRLMDIDEDDGPTYALQLYAESRGNYNRFEDEYKADTDAFAYEKWGSASLSFGTLMQVVE